MIDGAIVIAAVSAVGSGFAAYLAYRASSRANDIGEKKVDAEAYDRSHAFYEKLLGQADTQLERLRVQVERLNDQLAKEQDVSNLLRNHVRTLQSQVDSMEGTMQQLRRAPRS